MPRTTPTAVRDILGRDYDTTNEPTLNPYIRAANLIVNRVVTCATAKGFTHTTDELQAIEGWLAAHFYTKSDPVYASKSTGGASASFVRGKEEPEPYRDGALMLDSSGCLKAILAGQRASLTWLGKPQSEQIAYEDRD